MQRGYILITTLILLALLAAISVALSERRTQSARLTAEENDAQRALLLAENAAEWVYARFIYGADLDGDGRPDNRQHGDLSRIPPRHPAFYIFHLPRGPGIEPHPQSLLQRIAEAEAGAALSNETLGPRIQDLFGPRQRPLHFLADEHGLPQLSDQPWTALAGRPHAAVWMELVPDPERGGHRLYLQTVAEVGLARRYLQRLIGRYDNRLGSDLGALTETSPGPIPGGGPPP